MKKSPDAGSILLRVLGRKQLRPMLDEYTDGIELSAENRSSRFEWVRDLNRPERFEELELRDG